MMDVSMSDCFVTYIDFWYRLGISPCKLKVNPDTQVWEATSSRRHKILSSCVAVVLFLSIYSWVRHLNSNENTKKLNKQLNYFEKAGVFGLFFNACCLFVSFWQRGPQFADLINYSQASAAKAALGPSRIKNGKSKASVLIATVTAVYTVTEYLRYLEWNSWDFASFYNGMSWWGRGLIFLESVKFGTWTVYAGHIGLMLGIVAKLVFALFRSAGVTFMLLLMQQMYWLILHLETKAKNMISHDGVQEFRKFRTMIVLLNRATGVAVCGCVFGCIPALIKCIPQAIQPIGVVMLINSIVFAMIPLLFLVCAAWFNAKAKAIFHNWIVVRKNFVLFQESDLIMLLHEISSEKLAIKPFEFISLDSSFLGTVCGLTLTFSVVIIQFESQK